MADLPRPDVSVTRPQADLVSGTTPNAHAIDVVISRDGKAKSYRGNQSTTEESVADVVRQIINDPATGEFLPAGKRF